MAQLNTRAVATPVFTHEGARAALHLKPIEQLRRVVLACMLWEDQFYVDGVSQAEIVKAAVKNCDPAEIATVAVEARDKQKLRHMPLLLVRELIRHPKVHEHPGLAAATLATVIQRPDELTEFMALYYADKKDEPLAAAAKKGLAEAFTKFNEYALAKYNQDKAWKLRDVLFMCHAKPKDAEQAALWKRLVDGELKTPDTWEVALSGGANKREAWERLLAENKLGALAILRNLRNMQEAGVPDALIRVALVNMKTERVLPFRFIAAAKYGPRFEPELETAMFKCLNGHERLKGKTILLVDSSGSMNWQMSAKSDLLRYDAACGLAMLLREVCETVQIAKFANLPTEIPPRRGFGLRDALGRPQGGTHTDTAKRWADAQGYDRLIILTDEQSDEPLSSGPKGLGYVVNVASYKNGIGYGAWHHIDGWSEAIVDYILQLEAK